MKTVPVFLLCMSLFAFAAHAAGDNPLLDPLFDPTGLPFTTIAGVQQLRSETYAEIHDTFLDPIYGSDFCMVIDRIEINAACPEEDQWTVDIYLKTGEHIARNKMNSFYDDDNGRKPPFTRSLKSIFRELEGIMRREPKLKKFFHEEFPHHRAAS